MNLTSLGAPPLPLAQASFEKLSFLTWRLRPVGFTGAAGSKCMRGGGQRRRSEIDCDKSIALGGGQGEGLHKVAAGYVDRFEP